MNLTKKQVRELVVGKLSTRFGVSPEDATNEQLYNAVALSVHDLLIQKWRRFDEKNSKTGARRVYYLCMEFLMGRSLKNNLYNLGLTDTYRAVLEEFDVQLDRLYELEPDAGLGNGGLGRLAACFLDSLTSLGVPAMGYSILYEYGIFRQKLVEGWQTELPDFWLPGGECWLQPRPDLTVNVQFDGRVIDGWDASGYHYVRYENCNVVEAVPFDLYISGKNDEAVNILRLWSAKKNDFDMNLFNTGEYLRAVEQSAMAESISKVLYPNDNHREGKSLRLRQQYFLVSATIQNIIVRHLTEYKTMDNFRDKVVIHINDTHPALAIPELMRILMDDCGYPWDEAWDMVTHVVAYTNHTVMPEALECWPEELFASLLPRIYQIMKEINKRFVEQLSQFFPGDWGKINYMAIIHDGVVRMANLCACACFSINGVSELHSKLLRDRVFHDFYLYTPEKFHNVTNGIAHRRWLCQSNPRLTALLTELLGDGFVKDASQLEGLQKYAKDTSVLDRICEIKRENKRDFADYIRKTQGVVLDPDSIFDVQVKRLHEYKRQHLNALHILSLYQKIKENPAAPFTPQTFLFAAKAAPGYLMAKHIIRLIYSIGELVNNDPDVAGRLKVVYLEDYRVSLAERLMPAAEFSEQISLAGTEASGTGNMKLMINGAVTIGTLDGANVEIRKAVGDCNMILFGMDEQQVNAYRERGYHPRAIYDNNAAVRGALDAIHAGIHGNRFDEIFNSLLNTDYYMVLADFEAYAKAQERSRRLYAAPRDWARASLVNTANAGRFSADRSIRDYARDIWHVKA